MSDNNNDENNSFEKSVHKYEIHALAMYDENLHEFNLDFIKGPFYPTTTCFSDSLEFIMKYFTKFNDEKEKELFHVVHAIISPNGVPTAHSWVELNLKKNFVIQKNIMSDKYYFALFYLEEFESNANIIKKIKYSYDELTKIINSTLHLGPWDEEISKYIIGTKSLSKNEVCETINKIFPEVVAQ